MPKRSTPFQAIVRLVRQHLAGPGVTVTESKFLRDTVLDVDREVDIVIEGQLDGEPMVISIEVIERSRPATLPWVQEMIQKHRDLPTNRLILVSQSGFSSSAMMAIDREAGRVQALTPEVIEVDSQAIIKHFYLDSIIYKPRGCKVYVHADGKEVYIVGEPETDIYAGDGALLGPLAELTAETIQLSSVGEYLSIEAHIHPEREHVKAFTVSLTMPQLDYHLMRSDTGKLTPIKALEIWGDFTWQQTEVPLTITRLGERIYGTGEAPIAGISAIWVGTTDLTTETTKISWQAKSTVGSPQIIQQKPRPMRFPGLLTLSPAGAHA